MCSISSTTLKLEGKKCWFWRQNGFTNSQCNPIMKKMKKWRSDEAVILDTKIGYKHVKCYEECYFGGNPLSEATKQHLKNS